jgi:hypothetical protein
MQALLFRIAVVAMGLNAAGARADDPESRVFSFSGFGTLGAAHSGLDQADFVSNNGALVPNGAGHSRAWSLDVDSRIAAQATANFTDRLTGVVQVISEQRFDNTYKPTFEWANVQYSLTPDLSVRVGRTVLPVFMTSDNRKVGYTNPWVRPPIELYSLVPISNNDGVDMTYHLHTGDVTNTLQGLYGGKVSRTVDGGSSKATDTFDVSDTLEYGAWTLHFTRHQVKVALTEGAPKIPIRLLTVGASYDPGDWFAIGEWAGNRSDALGDSNAWYLTAGYRVNHFTPYFTYSRLKPLSRPGLGFPPSGQRNASAGVRWDFTKSVDAKLQYERLRLDAGSAGTLSNIQPGFVPGGRVNVLSATIDFVF